MGTALTSCNSPPRIIPKWVSFEKPSSVLCQKFPGEREDNHEIFEIFCIFKIY
jgi:hypothetical protein